MIQFVKAENHADFEGILQLQRENLPEALSPVEIQRDGFLTCRHDVDLLRKMNDPYAHVLAKDGDLVVGYALVMLPVFEADFPEIKPMFEEMKDVKYKGKALKDWKYFVMGQVCIHKNYRGKGIFMGLFQQLRLQMMSDFDFVITEIASRNIPSIKAHRKVGFDLLHAYQSSDGEKWEIVVWDF